MAKAKTCAGAGAFGFHRYDDRRAAAGAVHACLLLEPGSALLHGLWLTSVMPLVVDGVRRGLHESLKALAKGTRDAAGNVPEGGARVAILAKSQVEGDGKQLQKLVKALAQEKGCPLFEIDQALELGEWCVVLAGAGGGRCCGAPRLRSVHRPIVPPTGPFRSPPALASGGGPQAAPCRRVE
jgi:hypothetical protein